MTASESSNFIQAIINKDIKNNLNDGLVHTRFPPEPNGYLHIGHAKSICLNFGLANLYNGLCNLRFDDTNPTKEEVEYVESIKEDVLWLGFNWDERMFFASGYFQKLYDFALVLIEAGKAYVCDLTPGQMKEYRGTLTEPGKNSPYRDRSPEENRDLFCRMKAGEFPDGSRVLRAKIDMNSPNLNLRDPVLYRIQRTSHHRTGEEWLIYPMYDFAHPLSDAIEGVTHSICTLEFEDHRPLYDWVLDNLPISSRPRQYEFARLNLGYTVMSKRKLKALVEQGIVSGWDDPRMPTLSGLRRRGYTPEAIRDFCEQIGVAKSNSIVDIGMLEHCIRNDLNTQAPRVMGVLRPLKVIIDNYPENEEEMLPAENNPEQPQTGYRQIPFTKELYIEQDDFMENPPKKFFRMAPGQEVRLKHAYIIKCVDVIKDALGQVTELHCTYDPDTKSGTGGNTRKVKGTLHWVCAKYALPADVRIYEHLFVKENPEEDADFTANLNPNSVKTLSQCLVESSLLNAPTGGRYQFLRQGYFCVDKDSTPDKLVFNQIISLKDTWAKINK